MSAPPASELESLKFENRVLQRCLEKAKVSAERVAAERHRCDFEQMVYTSNASFSAGFYKACVDSRVIVSIDSFFHECFPLLLDAAERGHVRLVERLISGKADMNKADRNGCTPVFLAARAGNVRTVAILCDQGGNKDKPRSDG